MRIKEKKQIAIKQIVIEIKDIAKVIGQRYQTL